MKNEISNEVVTELLARVGVPEETWATTIAEVINASKDTAKRRLLNQGDFSLDELMLIARRFGTTVSAMLRNVSPQEGADPEAEDAIVLIGTQKLPCRVVTRTGHYLATTRLVAFATDGGEMIVTTADDLPATSQSRPVVSLRIDESSFSRVAVVDDEAPITLVRYLNAAGFEATHYSDLSSIIDSLKSGNRQDAYILDWTLSKGETCKGLIELIRKDGMEPILLLTGTIESNPNNETEIGQMMERFGVEVFLKPARPYIIAQKLSLMLRDGASS
jgi:hypothetical protein